MLADEGLGARRDGRRASLAPTRVVAHALAASPRRRRGLDRHLGWALPGRRRRVRARRAAPAATWSRSRPAATPSRPRPTTCCGGSTDGGGACRSRRGWPRDPRALAVVDDRQHARRRRRRRRSRSGRRRGARGARSAGSDALAVCGGVSAGAGGRRRLDLARRCAPNAGGDRPPGAHARLRRRAAARASSRPASASGRRRDGRSGASVRAGAGRRRGGRRDRRPDVWVAADDDAGAAGELATAPRRRRRRRPALPAPPPSACRHAGCSAVVSVAAADAGVHGPATPLRDGWSLVVLLELPARTRQRRPDGARARRRARAPRRRAGRRGARTRRARRPTTHPRRPPAGHSTRERGAAMIDRCLALLALVLMAQPRRRAGAPTGAAPASRRRRCPAVRRPRPRAPRPRAAARAVRRRPARRRPARGRRRAGAGRAGPRALRCSSGPALAGWLPEVRARVDRRFARSESVDLGARRRAAAPSESTATTTCVTSCG